MLRVIGTDHRRCAAPPGEASGHTIMRHGFSPRRRCRNATGPEWRENGSVIAVAHAGQSPTFTTWDRAKRRVRRVRKEAVEM